MTHFETETFFYSPTEFSSSRIAPRFLTRPVAGIKKSSSSSSSSSLATGLFTGELVSLTPSSMSLSSSSSNRSSYSLAVFLLGACSKSRDTVALHQCDNLMLSLLITSQVISFTNSRILQYLGDVGVGWGAESVQQAQASLSVCVGDLTAWRMPGQTAHREAFLMLLPAAEKRPLQVINHLIPFFGNTLINRHHFLGSTAC